MRYKILYIHNKTGISGGERSLLNLWRHMDREMFELFLILPGEGPFSEKAREYGVNIFYSKAPAFILKNLFRAVKTLFDWSRYVLNNRISLIHSYTPRNNILSGIIGRLFFRPVIWHERNLIYDDKFDVSRRFMFLPNRIICNSYAIAERFKHKDYRPAKVQVVHNGVDLNKYNPSLDGSDIRGKLFLRDRKVVGIVTNLSARKRVEFFLEAAVRIKQGYNNVVFIVVGGSFPAKDNRLIELRERVFFLGMDEDFIFTGFQENVREFISVFDVAVNVTDKEACSRAMMEYMACGKAVVAMEDGGSPELITSGENGILTHPLKIGDFADAVTGLLKDEQKRGNLGRKARAAAELKFDIKKNVLKTQNIYLELIEKK